MALENSGEQQPLLDPQKMSTVVGGWSVAVARALDALGCDGDALLKAAGVDLSKKLDVDARFNAHHTQQLWHLALAETGQVDIGLQVAQFVCPTTFHALGFSLWASPSLLDALRRMVRFDVLLNDGCTLQIEKQDQSSQGFSMSVKELNGKPLVVAEGVDYFLGAVVKMFRDMSTQDFSPRKVYLCRPEPEQSQKWRDYFQCDVCFNASQNQLIFDDSDLTRILPTGNAALAEQNDKLVEGYLSRLKMQDICGQVRAALIDLMPLGITTMDGVSEALGVYPRTLQYKLRQQNTTLQKLRDQIREELARQYLEHSRQPFTQIAYSLGFSDPAHFNRAFKRWSGETPTAYRNRTTLLGSR